MSHHLLSLSRCWAGGQVDPMFNKETFYLQMAVGNNVAARIEATVINCQLELQMYRMLQRGTDAKRAYCEGVLHSYRLMVTL